MKYRNNQIIYSPSDLSAHSGCKHLTQLNKQNARSEIADCKNSAQCLPVEVKVN